MNYIKVHDTNHNLLLINLNKVLYFYRDIYSKHVCINFENKQTLFILETMEEITTKILKKTGE